MDHQSRTSQFIEIFNPTALFFRSCYSTLEMKNQHQSLPMNQSSQFKTPFLTSILAKRLYSFSGLELDDSIHDVLSYIGPLNSILNTNMLIFDSRCSNSWGFLKFFGIVTYSRATVAATQYSGPASSQYLRYFSSSLYDVSLMIRSLSSNVQERAIVLQMPSPGGV